MSSDPNPLPNDPTTDPQSPTDALSAGAPPAVVTCAPTARSLLQALRRRWPLAAALGLLGGLLTFVAAWFVLPAPPHTARALLYIAADQPRVLFQTNEYRPDANAFRQTQLALIKSRLVLNAALRQPKVADLAIVRKQDDPISWLEKELRVAYSSSPEILSVSFSGDPPEEVKTIVDAVVAAYLTEIVNKEQIKRQARLDQLEKISTKYQENLRQKRLTLRRVAENVGTSDKQNLALKQLYTQEQYHLARKELLVVRSKLRELDAEAAVGPPDGPELPESLVNEVMQKDGMLAKYLAQRTQLENDLAQAKEKLQPELREQHPAVQRYLQSIAAVNRMIDKRKEELRPQVEAQVKDRMILDGDARGKTLDKRIEYYHRLEKQLALDVKRLEEECQAQTKGFQDVVDLTTDLTQAEEVAKKVAEEAEKLGVEQQAPSRVNVLEEAVIDWNDSRSRQLRTAGLAGFAAIGLLVLAVAWWEFRHRRVQTVEQVVHGLGMRLVGTVPAQPARLGLRRGAPEQVDDFWRSMLHESVSAARAQLLHMAKSGTVKVVMITSAVAGEGKTSLASQLASSLANSGRKTLLIDADLRNPAAHRLFEIPATPGCCEVLRTEIDPADAVQRTRMDRLSLLPAGQFDNQALSALAQTGLEPLLESQRSQFDFIIVDSSPVLPVADAVQIAPHVDGVIFSVLRNVSQLPRVHAARQRLAGLGIPVLGAVVLGTDEESGGYGYRHNGRRTRETMKPQPRG
jgi:capsular exopolysaccharide synthesis family protein